MARPPSTPSHPRTGAGPRAKRLPDVPRERSVVRLLVLAAALALSVTAAHSPVLRANAVGLDDDMFVVHNPLVSRPGWDSVRRFFVEVTHPSTVDAYYLPLSMTSLMLDVAAGARAGHLAPFHATSLALHVATCVLLFLLLERLFGAAMPAAFAALLYGLHPLTVEAIASAGERKTVLAACFGFACAYAHVRYSERLSAAWRWASVALFGLALLSKPSVLTLPIGLLVLDAWPLRRWSRRAVLEKWPHMALASAMTVITLLAYRNTWVFGPPPPLDPGRLAVQVPWVLAFYLGKLAWPVGLSTVYGPPSRWTLADPGVGLPVLGMLALGLAALWLRRRAPGGLAGATLFAVLLAPTLGILRFSPVITCDRYVYLPGLAIAVGLAAAFTRAWRARAASARIALVLVVMLAAVAEAALTRTALQPWRETLDLWRQAVRVSPGAPDAHNGLGATLSLGGQRDSALAEFRRAIAIDSTHADSQYNLGRELTLAARNTEAIPHLAYAARLMPGSARSALQLGVAYRQSGRLAEAAGQFRRALELKPGYVLAISNLGVTEALLGRSVEGERHLREALALSPEDPAIRYTLAAVLAREAGATPEAIDMLREVLRADPGFAAAGNELAWLLATAATPALRDSAEALHWSARVLELRGNGDAHVLDTRAAALACAGRFGEAISVSERAGEMALAQHDEALARSIRERARLYRSGRPWVDTPATASGSSR